jgi:hypothetical protein
LVNAKVNAQNFCPLIKEDQYIAMGLYITLTINLLLLEGMEVVMGATNLLHEQDEPLP